MMDINGIFILFLVITNPGYSGPTQYIVTQEFSSQKMCNWAKDEIIPLASNGRSRIIGVCIPKDEYRDE